MMKNGRWFFRLIEIVLFFALFSLLYPLEWWRMAGLVVSIILFQVVAVVEEHNK